MTRNNRRLSEPHVKITTGISRFHYDALQRFSGIKGFGYGVLIQQALERDPTFKALLREEREAYANQHHDNTEKIDIIKRVSKEFDS